MLVVVLYILLYRCNTEERSHSLGLQDKYKRKITFWLFIDSKYSPIVGSECPSKAKFHNMSNK